MALKTLCGFSPAEIATAFLTIEAAVAKRLTRAKQKIQEARIRFEIPVGEELARRLDGVLQSLGSYYLLHAVLGEFEARLNHSQAAASHFRKSLQLAEIKSERMFLSKRLQASEGRVRA